MAGTPRVIPPAERFAPQAADIIAALLRSASETVTLVTVTGARADVSTVFVTINGMEFYMDVTPR